MSDSSGPDAAANTTFLGIFLGLVLLIAGALLGGNVKAPKFDAYGDVSYGFNWSLFATFAVGAAICFVLSFGFAAIVRALRS